MRVNFGKTLGFLRLLAAQSDVRKGLNRHETSAESKSVGIRNGCVLAMQRRGHQREAQLQHPACRRRILSGYRSVRRPPFTDTPLRDLKMSSFQGAAGR